MYSEDRESAPNSENSVNSEPIPTLQRRTIHPDSLKFMDMAKELLDNSRKQTSEAEQESKESE